MCQKTKKTVSVMGKIFMVMALVGLLLYKKYHRQEWLQLRDKKEQVMKARKEYQIYQDSLQILREKVVRDSVYDARRKEMQKKRQTMKKNIKRLEKEVKSKK